MLEQGRRMTDGSVDAPQRASEMLSEAQKVTTTLQMESRRSANGVEEVSR